MSGRDVRSGGRRDLHPTSGTGWSMLVARSVGPGPMLLPRANTSMAATAQYRTNADHARSRVAWPLLRPLHSHPPYQDERPNLRPATWNGRRTPRTSPKPRLIGEVFVRYSKTSTALVAQGIEHGSPKAGVAGSNPAGGTDVFAGPRSFLSRADRPAPQPHPNVGGSLTSANPAENSLSHPRRVALVSTRAAVEPQVPMPQTSPKVLSNLPNVTTS